MPMSQSQRRRRSRRVGLHPVLAHKSVLIVEDEPLVALDIHTILSGVGASVLSAASVSEANRLLAFADVACAIIDVHLGSEDDFQGSEARELQCARPRPTVMDSRGL